MDGCGTVPEVTLTEQVGDFGDTASKVQRMATEGNETSDQTQGHTRGATVCAYTAGLSFQKGGWELPKAGCLAGYSKVSFKDILEWHRMSKRQTPRR